MNTELSLKERFEKFDTDNPHVYDRFSKYAYEALQSGKKTFSHWLIANRIRWDHAISTDTSEKYKLSNDFIALYARKWMKINPEHAGFFKTKAMKR